jgi:hypothetical protein
LRAARKFPPALARIASSTGAMNLLHALADTVGSLQTASLAAMLSGVARNSAPIVRVMFASNSGRSGAYDASEPPLFRRTSTIRMGLETISRWCLATSASIKCA